MEESREKEVMEAALQAGHLLLENGAEISRVEETMERICRYYGVHSGNAFVLTNGIFVTVGNRNEPVFAKVEHIPVSGTHLDRVAAVNQLSREIEEGRYTIGQVSGWMISSGCPERQSTCRCWHRAAAALPSVICLGEMHRTAQLHLQPESSCIYMCCI